MPGNQVWALTLETVAKGCQILLHLAECFDELIVLYD